jgi:hypothetical protein
LFGKSLTLDTEIFAVRRRDDKSIICESSGGVLPATITPSLTGPDVLIDQIHKLH